MSRPTTQGSQAETGGTPLYALPDTILPLTAARGSILTLDWHVLTELGIYDAYVAALDSEHWKRLASVTAGAWVPLQCLRWHYAALDSLKLPQERIVQVGRTVGERVHGSFLTTLIRLAGKLGVSPWLPLEQTYKLWVRSWQGGAIAVHRVSETQARVTILRTGVCASPFFCTSFGGAVEAGVAPFGKGTAVACLTDSRTDQSVAYRVTWSG